MDDWNDELLDRDRCEHIPQAAFRALQQQRLDFWHDELFADFGEVLPAGDGDDDGLEM